LIIRNGAGARRSGFPVNAGPIRCTAVVVVCFGLGLVMYVGGVWIGVGLWALVGGGLFDGGGSA
jgi:hypothetical protein